MGEFPSKENQFQKGNPGGPGRPRLKTILDVARERISEVGSDDRSLAETIFDEWLAMIAEGGNTGLAALKELLNRLHGKNPVKIEADVEVTATHRDGDLPEILAALGYERRGAEAGGGAVEPGGPGCGGIEGPLEAGPPPEAPERPADRIREGDRPGRGPAAPGQLPPPPRQERPDQRASAGVVSRQEPGPPGHPL
jgi:hypothetical protein